MRPDQAKNKYPLHIERSISDTWITTYQDLVSGLQEDIFEQLDKDFSLQTRDMLRQDSIFNVFGIIRKKLFADDSIVGKLAEALLPKYKILDSWVLNKIEESMNDRSKILNQVRPKQWALVNGEWKQIYKPLEKKIVIENGVTTVKYQTEELAINPNKFRNPIVAKQMDDVIAEKAKQNAQLIKGITETRAEKLSESIRDAYLKGKTSDEIKEIVKKQIDVGDARAANIARDQVNKLAGTINAERQKKIGINKFTWRTMQDPRVREKHQHLEGKSFDWETGAIGLLDLPDSRFPGDDPNCRCYAEPGDATEIEPEKKSIFSGIRFK